MIKNILVFTFLSTLLVNKLSIAQSNAPVLLSNPPSNIGEFRIDANSKYVVFNQFEQDDRDDIGNRLSIKIDGSNPANILTNNIILRSNRTFQTEVDYSFDNDDARVISPDSSTGGLLSTSLNDQPIILLLAPNNERIIEFSELNDNTPFQVFLTDQGHLYSIDSSGDKPAILLSSNINLSEGEFVDFFLVSPDRLSVIFIVESSDGTESSNGINFDQNLFSVPINGSLAPTLIHDIPSNTNASNNILIDESSTRVIYTINSNDGITQLFSTSIDGSSPPIALSDPLTFTSINFKISNDSQSVVFSFSESGLLRLLSVPADGSDTPTIIDEAFSINGFQISSNSKTIIYSILTNLRSRGGVTEIFSSPVNGNTPPVSLLNNPDISKESINISSRDIVISDSSKFVVFRNRNFSTSELFLAPIDGASPTINIVSGLDDSPADFSIVINEQQSKIIFRASRQLMSVDFDGLNLTPLSREQNVVFSDFLVSPDGNFLVYNSQQGLFSIKLEKENDQLCFPIQAKNDDFVTICL